MKIQAILYKGKTAIQIGSEIRIGGTKSWRHNNVGNLRWSPYQIGNIDNFSVFKTYEDGWKALLHQLTIAINGKSKVYNPEMTLADFFSVYAPSSDNNNPQSYAKAVAQRLKVAVGFQIKNFII